MNSTKRILVALTLFVTLTTTVFIFHFNLGEIYRYRSARPLTNRHDQLMTGVGTHSDITESHSISPYTKSPQDVTHKSDIISRAYTEGKSSVKLLHGASTSVEHSAVHTNVSVAVDTKEVNVRKVDGSQKTSEATASKNKSVDSVVKEKNVSVPEKNAAPTTNRPMTCKGCFLSNFTILVENTKICDENSNKPVLIMMITSTHAIDSGQDRRMAIRETWVSITKNNTWQVRYMFMLGTTNDEQAMSHVMNESARFGDILMADFVDVYANLTLKTMMGLRWITAHCGQAKFFLKTDQDMFIFVDRLLELLHREENTLKTTLGGNCFQSGKPWREPKTKYFASIQSYPQPTYPGFCSGTGYIGHMDLARKVVETSPSIPFFHLEDVYVTLVLRHVGYHLKKYDNFAVGFGDCNNPSVAKMIYTIHEVKPEIILKIWKEKLCGL